MELALKPHAAHYTGRRARHATGPHAAGALAVQGRIPHLH
jgi:hypothetical protein